MESTYSGFETPKDPRVVIDMKLKEQDNQLDEIQSGAKRLKERARAMDTEIVSQNRFIDGLSQDVSRADQELQQGTNQARFVNKMKKKNCIYYVVILIEILVLVIVIAIPGKNK